ncbi:MAG TPA: HAD-IA family hydrolase [Polyangiaceae bacterium]|nr:HAD-IA family hydrolase [Polyangiaceae bacterium]
MNLSDYTHLIFDLDGVLLDTEKLYTEATQCVVGEYGKTFDWALKSQMMGRHEREAAELLVKTLELPISAEEYRRRSAPIAEGLFRTASELPGAEAFVAKLAERGHTLAVGTSSTRRLYDLKTSHLPWFRLFSAVVSGDHPEVRALKPAPDIFLAAARAIAGEPARCLVIEDSPAGVLAARAAGMSVVAIPDAALSDERFAEAQLIVRSYAELRAHLKC